MTPMTYRVIGVRSNGKRVVISQHNSREIAEKVVRLIEYGSPFKELLIEGAPDDMRPPRHSLR